MAKAKFPPTRNRPTVIVVANHKGGVGKTTSAVSIAHSLAYRGHTTLLIDCDPQNNASQCFPSQAEAEADNMTLCSVLRGERLISTVLRLVGPNLYLISSSPKLSQLEKVLGTDDTHPFWLQQQLYDPIIQTMVQYVVIDTPPSLNAMTVTALGAAHSLVIPMLPEPFAFTGMDKLLGTVARVRQYFNSNLELTGVFLTQFAWTYRGTLYQQFADALRQDAQLSSKLFKATVRENVRLPETQADAVRQPIHDYAPGSNGSEDYLALTDELLDRLNHENSH